MPTNSDTLYVLLGVPEDADTSDILRAYRRLAAAHHPDAGGDADVFHAATQAKDTLADEASRAAYDEELAILRRAGALAPADGQPAPVAMDFTVAGADPVWFLRNDRQPGDTRSPSWAPRRPDPAAALIGATAAAAGAAAASLVADGAPVALVAVFVVLGAVVVSMSTWGNRAPGPVALVVLGAPMLGVAGLAAIAAAGAVATTRTVQGWSMSVSKMVEGQGVTAPTSGRYA